MKELSGSWKDLGDEEKSSIAMSLAGKNHMEVFEATLGNFNSALKANVVAQNAAGSAAKENAKYMDSIEGKVEALKSAWSDFSNSMLKSDTVKGVLSGLTGVLKVLSSDFGQTAIKALALVTAIGLASKALTVLKGLTLSGYAGIGTAITSAIGSLKSLAGGITALFSLIKTEGLAATLTGLVNPFVLAGAAVAGVGVALGGVMTLYGKYVEKGDKVLQQQKEAVKAVKDWQKAHKTTLDIQKRVNEKQSELNQLLEKQNSGTLTDAEKERLGSLQQELDVQNKILAAQREAEGLKWQKKETTLGKKGLNARDFEEMGQQGWTAQETWENRYGVSTKAGKALVQYQQSTQNVTKAREKLAKVEKQLADAQENGRKKGESIEEWNDRVNTLTEKQSKLKGELATAEGEAATQVQNMLDKKSEYDEYMENGVKLTKEQKEEYENLCDAIEDYDTLTDLTTTDMDGAIKTMTKYGKGMGIIADESGKVNEIKLDEFSSSLSHAGKTADEIYEYLEAISDANPNAKITLDGAEVSVGEAEAVLQYLQAIDQSNPDATVTIGGVTYATSELQVVDGKLQTLDGTVVTTTVTANDEATGKVDKLQGKTDLGTAKKKITSSGYSSTKKQLDTLANRTSLGTATKTIVTEHVHKANGTRNFSAYAKGTDNALNGNAEVNEQGFEIIQSPSGAMRIANAGKRGATFIEEGAAVYTHGQSMRMLQKAGKTEADLLQGKTGDIGVFGLRKLEGFKKGISKKTKKKKQKEFDNALATLEYQRDYYNWTDSTYAAKYKALYNKYATYLTTDQSREYNKTIADINRSYAQENIETNMDLFENQKKTYDEMLTLIKNYYKAGKINAEEYADYIKELNEQQVENIRDNYSNQWDYMSEYIQRQIDLEEENNDLLEAQADLLSATTQKVKVYREGVGFVYEADEEAVKEAQEDLKSYSSVWEQIQDMMDDVESQIDLQKLATMAGSSLVNLVTGAGTDTSTWSNLIKLVGGNMGAYDLASDLGITDPNSITKATTVNGQTFNIDNISLPSVTNANEFVSQLQTMAIQATGSRS